MVLFVMDLIACWLVWLCLRRMNMDPAGLVVYWWNPLFVKEIYNSAHMDGLLLPFLLGAFLLFNEKRYLLASGALGIAVGLKFWPAILLPVILRPIIRNPKRFIPAILVFAVFSVAMVFPFYQTGLDRTSGLTASQLLGNERRALYAAVVGGEICTERMGNGSVACTGCHTGHRVRISDRMDAVGGPAAGFRSQHNRSPISDDYRCPLFTESHAVSVVLCLDVALSGHSSEKISFAAYRFASHLLSAFLF
jgi:hypothetical protein